MVKHDLLARGIASVVGAIVNGLQTTVNNLAITVANHATYSTTEEIVIGTYDGKPLYRKCLSIANFPNTSVVNYPHGIENVEKIFIGSNSHARSGGDFLPLPFPHHSVNYAITVIPTVTVVTIGTGINRSSVYGKIFLEYTKTTD